MKKVQKGFSEKKDGSMYLAVPENAVHRKQFFEEQGLGGKQVAIAELVHGTHVETITSTSSYMLPETDAMVTKASGVVLALTGADCFPVYFEEKAIGIIGLAHCGWRGITAGIIGETLAAIGNMGGKMENIVLTIGPGICAEHFEIKEDVLSSFSAYPDSIIRDRNIRVDLKKIIKRQAKKAGVINENIVDTEECTHCLRDKYYSFRRDHPKILETQIAYIVQFPHRKF